MNTVDKQDFNKGVYHATSMVDRQSKRDGIAQWLAEMKEDGDIDWYMLGVYIGYIHTHG